MDHVKVCGNRFEDGKIVKRIGYRDRVGCRSGRRRDGGAWFSGLIILTRLI